MSDEEIDMLLERFDQTDPKLQRRIIAEFVQRCHKFEVQRDELLAALEQIVTDWDSVDPNAQVPDEINDDEHWEAARAAIAEAKS